MCPGGEKRKWEPDFIEELEGWDDVNNVGLPMAEVETAKAEESKYMINREIWTNVSEEECWRVTGRAPIDTRWVITDVYAYYNQM